MISREELEEATRALKDLYDWLDRDPQNYKELCETSEPLWKLLEKLEKETPK